MTSVRSTRRLGSAVATVLAVTLGATALAAPPAAAAAPSSSSADVGARNAPLPMEPGSYVVAAGSEGFFTQTDRPSYSYYRWTRYSDGATTDLRWFTTEQEDHPYASGNTAAIEKPFENEVRIFDGATGSTDAVPVDADTYDLRIPGIAGGGVFTVADTAGTPPVLKLHTRAEGTREVVGSPLADPHAILRTATTRHALIDGKGADGKTYWIVVDLASAKVVESYVVPAKADRASVTLSDTRIAWVEYEPGSQAAKAVVRNRAGGGETAVPLGQDPDRKLSVRLLGDDWITFGKPGGGTATTPSPLHALTARHLTSGETYKLLDHMVSTADVPEGGQVVGGGTLAQGEGAYRIALDTSGRPAASLVAAIGTDTIAQVEPAKVPTGAVDLDNTDVVPFRWHLNRSNVYVEIRVRRNDIDGWAVYREVRTGLTAGLVALDWRGDINGDSGPAYTDAPTGDYTWEITATPLDGIGPVMKDSGTFTATREPRHHDFDRNGAPDLLVRSNGSNDAAILSTYFKPDTKQLTGQSKPFGSGWRMFDRIESVGDVAGDASPELVGRDKDGVLWIYEGRGRSTLFQNRKQVGGGWQVYKQLAGGSDLTGDGRADLVASDTSGVLWLYAGTGQLDKPFAPRKRIGAGWQTYNQLTAVGDLAGGPGGDLVARDHDGVLWLYLGRGDGTFTARTKIGAGWNAYTELIGSGDANRDGKADLLAFSPRDRVAYFYAGTGDRHRPFEKRANTALQVNPTQDHFA
ncbi:VCBS repeat-containing protein [Streptomyces sp. P9(2023)]|uniref:FG-GAP repeat domain-containing protein n=1 Tax=Streptomyces sp. P9(2023) TaxID=3064394 RepID=UPI0028F42BAC|nr:VCBS repeat-containing protein [Streptomyces sp. P9(2023)]MDT9690511.1 VCBS repeat-containing protein [Streptomyces sp. P9(2023)]